MSRSLPACLALALAGCGGGGGAGDAGSTAADSAGGADGSALDAAALDAAALDAARMDSSASDGGSTACAEMDLGSALGRDVASGTTTGAGDDYTITSCGFARDAPDLIYLWTAPRAGVFAFDLAGSSFDTVLALLGGGC